MSDLNPIEIFRNYELNNLDLKSTINYLISFIENYENDFQRVLAINLLGKLEFNGNHKVQVYNVIENCLLSDNNLMVRLSAFNIITHKFPNKCIAPLKWTIQNDKYNILRKKALKYLFSINNKDDFFYDYLRVILLNDTNPKIKKIILKYVFENYLDIGLATIHHLIEKETYIIVLNTILNICEKLESSIAEKLLNATSLRLEREYGVVKEEARFLFDFEYIMVKAVDRGRITRMAMKTNSMDEFFDCRYIDDYYGQIYAIKDNHIIALDFALHELFLDQLPNSFEALKELKWLNMYLYLKNFPDCFDKFAKLEFLYVNSYRLDNLPPSLFNVAKEKMAQHYIKEGILPQEAQALAMIEILLGEKLKSKQDIVAEHARSFDERSHYCIDDSGHVIQLQIGPQNYYVDRNRTDDMSIIPHEISLLKHLRELYIFDLPIRIIPESIGDILSLRKLEIQGTKLKNIPKTIGNLKNLEYFSLYNNELEELPESIGDLENLYNLSLDENNLNIIPNSIGKLKNLNRISMSENNIRRIPESVSKLRNLEYFTCHKNNLKGLPESIGNLKNLKVLWLSNNQINEIPESFGKLENLSDLLLDNNDILILPESIGNLTNLTRLILSVHNVKIIPESLKNLNKLEDFELTYEKKEKKPKWLENLLDPEFLKENYQRRLMKDFIQKGLNQEQAEFFALLVSFGYAGVEEFKEIELESEFPETSSRGYYKLNKEGQIIGLAFQLGEKFSDIPNQLGNFKMLEELNIDLSCLKNIPDWMGNFSNLRKLSVSNTGILTIIPNSIGKLKSLEYLNLRGNKFKTVPDSIGNLKSLQYLDLSYNAINIIPESIEKLSSLKILDLRGNQIVNIHELMKFLERKGITIYK